MKVYKLLRIRKNGTLAPLFINKKMTIPVGVWLDAEPHPTKNYTFRPFWHCTSNPVAPHLSEKGRVWYEVEIENYTEMVRPPCQGGIWYLASRMKVIKEHIK